MARQLAWIFGLSTGLVLATNAMGKGLDVCDSLGLSGLTISSDSNCLQISGGVTYDFNWGDSNGNRADCPTPKVCDAGTVLALSDDLLLSNFRISVDPGAFFVAPQPYGLLETGAPATTPAYEVDVGYTGFKIGAGIDATVSYGNFLPMDLGFDFEVGKMSGRGTTGAVAIPGGIGVPSVGLIDGTGVIAGDILSTDLLIDRTFAGLDKHLNVPLFGGRHDFMGMDTYYTGYGILGTRFGAIGETQTTRIATTNGTVNYDSQIDGGYFGLYGGLGMDKTMPFGDNGLVLNGSLTATAGLDFHRYRVTDSVSGTYGHAASTNSYDVASTVPVLKFGTDLSIGNQMWNFGVNASVSSGRYPAFYIDRPVSNQRDTGFNVLGGVAGEFSAYWKGKF